MLALLGLVAVVVLVGEATDDPGAQPVHLGMRQFQGGDLLQLVVQQPGVVDQRLHDQRLAPRNRAALAAHDR